MNEEDGRILGEGEFRKPPKVDLNQPVHPDKKIADFPPSRIVNPGFTGRKTEETVIDDQSGEVPIIKFPREAKITSLHPRNNSS